MRQEDYMLEFETKVKELKFLTQYVVELTVELERPDRITFLAGQYMQFRISNDALKSYSIISVPDHNKSLKFCIELYPDGVGSNFVRNLKPGDQVNMRGPMGIFTLSNFDRNVFFVATGVGIAPFASIIPDILSRGFKQEARLLFGLRHEEDVFYFDKFNHLSALYHNFKFTPTLSRPKMHWPGEVGRVTTHLDAHYEFYKDYLFYICGSQEAVGDIRNLLLRRGHKPEDIRHEIFL